MAHTKSSIKDIKRIKVRTERNIALRSKMRTYLRKARESVDQQNVDAPERVNAAMRVLDKMVTKGIIKKNNASRRKSRLMKRLNVTLNVDKPQVLKEEKAIPEETIIDEPEIKDEVAATVETPEAQAEETTEEESEETPEALVEEKPEEESSESDEEKSE